jgi:hypothetical protein
MSMSIGVAMGFRVFVCDNLAFSGEIKVLRKHTKKVWEDLDQVLVYTLFRKGPELVNQFRQDVTTLKGSRMDRDVGFEFMGFAYGRQLLTPTQFSVAANEWDWKIKASQEKDHVPHAWDLYNAITVGLKSTPPAKIMEKHRELHQHLIGYAE